MRRTAHASGRQAARSNTWAYEFGATGYRPFLRVRGGVVIGPVWAGNDHGVKELAWRRTDRREAVNANGNCLSHAANSAVFN